MYGDWSPFLAEESYFKTVATDITGILFIQSLKPERQGSMFKLWQNFQLHIKAL